MVIRIGRRTAGAGHLVLRIVLLAISCVLAAGIVATLLLPAIGGVGLAAKAAADHFNAFKTDLVEPSLAQRTVLLDDKGHVLAQLHGPEDRVIVPTAAEIPEVMKQAIIAIEDSRFYQHHGVDFQGVARALVRNGQSTGPTQGGSTITQQYVKNVLEESAHTDEQRKAATADTTDRKLQEARYALKLETVYSKDEILRRYLNIANFGDGVYGVGTAVQHYFGVPLAKITVPEAAMLAGIVNSPTAYDPFVNPDASVARRNIVLARMQTLGYIDLPTKVAAEAQPAPKRPRSGRAPADACEGGEAPFFCFYVRDLLQRDKQLGDTQADRDHTLYDGGLTIKTTLDPKVQAALQTSIDAVLPISDKITAIAVAVEPGTGKVLGMAANRIYSSTKGIGHTKLGYLGYRTTFQGGSTFKLFTLAAALSNDIPVTTTILAKNCYFQDLTMYDPTGPNGPCPHGYQNSDPAEEGTYDLVSGTWYSVNTFFVQLEEKVGVQKVIDAAEAMGINKNAFDSVKLGPRSLSVTLGAVEGVSPLEEATAYATVAAHGIECDPNPIVSVRDPESTPVPVSERTRCGRVLDTGVADTIAGILEGVLNEPGATASGKGLDGRIAAGKTGTLDSEEAAWFSGFVPQLATSVVIGDPAHPTTPLGTVADVNPVFDGVDALDSPLFGGTLPATIWQRAMNQALIGVPAAAMPAQLYGSVAPIAAPPDKKGKKGKKGGKPSPPATAPTKH